LKKCFGADEDLYQVAYIKTLDILVSADGKGHIRLMKMGDFEALKPIDSPQIQEFKLDAGARSMRVSPDDKETYLAFGSESGTVHIFETRYLHKEYKYHAFPIH